MFWRLKCVGESRLVKAGMHLPSLSSSISTKISNAGKVADFVLLWQISADCSWFHLEIASVKMQVMLTKEVAESSGFSLKLAAPTGTSLLVEGTLARTPEGTEQVNIESDYLAFPIQHSQNLCR